eukprot:gene5978-6217_t
MGFPQKPMVKCGNAYYRAGIISVDWPGERVLLSFDPRHDPPSEHFWLPFSSKRIWRGSYRAAHWERVGLAFDTLRDMSNDTHIDPSRLETIAVLGEGAYAKVEKAWYTPPGGGERYMVAVKRLKKELFKNLDDLKLFEKEVDLVRKLRHRNIVDFIGAGELAESSECAYVVQEFMGGGTLKQLVTKQMLAPRSKDGYTNSQGLDICLEMARGLRYLHRSKPMVIHRDLKLENVLLKSECDLLLSWQGGLVGSTGRNDLEAEWTSRVDKSFTAKSKGSANMGPVNFDLTGRTGSLMYMAPEVFRGEPYSEKADVFSFGIMMYEVIQKYIMLSAVSIRGTYEELEDYCARVAGGYRPPIHKHWPEPLKQLIQDCWASAASARPHMEEVVARLEQIKEDKLLESQATSQQGCSCVIC